MNATGRDSITPYPHMHAGWQVMAISNLPLVALQPLTVPVLLHCVVTPIDARGRLADSSPARFLGLAPGHPISITAVPHDGRQIIDVRPGGPNAVTRQGHLRIPAYLRHLCRIATGDRLLVAAMPGHGLTVYTMDLLSEILSGSAPPGRG
ncbi:hypothetical protein [Streptomyces sp. SID13031]|uniref:hypothetical protein n=1 Tax=Streptomyces sp. SID13031 TaxID=2706046 RepID=UPI0013C56956|nr:hypothetical protein [Streptomyces sp. SID13031]NEA31224.1 hypothetical protein [Streptomyces sp. SID13031]